MKRMTSAFAGTLGLLLSVAGCSSSDNNASAPKKTIVRTGTMQSEFTPVELEATVNTMVDEINKATPTPMQMNVIMKNASAYFQGIMTGSTRAMAELQVTGNVSGIPDDAYDAATGDQIAMINDAVTQGAKGIGVAPYSNDVIQPINDAVAAGVPVVTIDGDLSESNRDLYIGTANKAAGATAGNTIMQFLPQGGGTVIILGFNDPLWPDGYNRTMGAQEVLEAAGYTVSVIGANWSDQGATDIAAMVPLFTSSDPPVVGMMGMFSNAYECAQAAEQAGKTDIPIVAFDFDPKTVAYMQSGLIKATHTQRQYYMGYLTPYVLYGFNVLGKEATKQLLSAQMIDQSQFNTGLDVVPADKLDAYAAFQDSLGIGSSN